MADLHDPWRRTRWVALGSVAVFASLAPLTMAGALADAADEPGQGLATAQTTKIDPKAGGLSIGLTFGISTSDHRNQVAKALSQATHTGVVGTTMAAEGCDGSDPTWPREDQPKALVVDSRDEAAHDGETEPEHGGMWEKFAKATEEPYAEAVTTTGPGRMGPLGEMSGAVARTSSGFVDGERVARATVDIGMINLFNVVRLAGLRWDVVYDSTGDKEVDGTFAIGAASVNGQAVPTQDPSATLDAANVALEPFGLKLTPAKTVVTEEFVRIEPLALSVVPNSTRDAAASALIEATHSGREELFDRILEEYCRAGTYISVFDIAVGSMTGAGEFVLSFGGAQASSGEMPENPFTLDPGPIGTTPGLFIPPVPPSITTIAGATFTTPGMPGRPASPPTAATGRITRQAIPIDYGTPKPFEGSRGGALAVVGLVTLGTVAVVAEGDRRKMRAALRRMGEATQ